MKISKILLNVCAFFCFVYFALYIFTLVFIPIGIYCFLAGKTFCFKAEHPEEDMKVNKKKFKAYVIFASIACFPFGLLSIIPYYLLASNKIKVTTIQSNEEPATPTSNEAETPETQPQKEETEEEKMEKFKKLQSFKEKGLITEEELEQAREQLFGSDDNK